MRIQEFTQLSGWLLELLDIKQLDIYIVPYERYAVCLPELYYIASGEGNENFHTALFSDDYHEQITVDKLSSGFMLIGRCRLTKINLAVLVGEALIQHGYISYLASANKILQQYGFPTGLASYVPCILMSIFSEILDAKLALQTYQLTALSDADEYYRKLGFTVSDSSSDLNKYTSLTPTFPAYGYYRGKGIFERRGGHALAIQRYYRGRSIVKELNLTQAMLRVIELQLSQESLAHDLRIFFRTLQFYYNNITRKDSIQVVQTPTSILEGLRQCPNTFLRLFSNLRTFQQFLYQYGLLPAPAEVTNPPAKKPHLS